MVLRHESEKGTVVYTSDIIESAECKNPAKVIRRLVSKGMLSTSALAVGPSVGPSLDDGSIGTFVEVTLSGFEAIRELPGIQELHDSLDHPLR